MFERSFTIPLLQTTETKTQINRNLNELISSVFDPIESIKHPKMDPIHKRVIPYFNKMYENLSCEKINVLETPIEGLFVTLSKLSWNRKLSWSNRSKIDKICSDISGEKCPGFFSKNKLDKYKEKDDFENLKIINDTYNFIFQNWN